MNAPRFAACLLLCSALPLAAGAASNLGEAGYPAHACGDKPVAPQRKAESRRDADVNRALINDDAERRQHAKVVSRHFFPVFERHGFHPLGVHQRRLLVGS